MSKIIGYVIIAVTITLFVASPSQTANILAVLPHQGLSHHMVYLPILRGLADRGHNVTVISNFPMEHPNITDISIMGSVPMFNNKISIDEWSKSKSEIYFSLKVILSFYTKGKVYESMLTVDDVKQLLNGPSVYDLLLTEHFNNELFLVFAHKFNVPFILMSSCNMLTWNEHAVGQPYALAIKPSTLSSGLSRKMNLIDRTLNTIFTVIQALGWAYLCRKRDEESIKQKLNVAISLDPLVLNASLIFVNTHFTVYGPRPLVPAVVEVGGIHIQPAEPLPADIQQFIDEAEHGLIYFCMGSMLRGESFPAKKRQMFLNVFKKIPQRILWKWEGDELPGKPQNVMIRKWMPQRDILAHPNVKLFISHGGLLGTTEAVYEGVPILSMPMFGDQMTNMKAAEDKGVALVLDFADLNEDDILTKIKSLLTDPTFKQNAKELSDAFRDRPMSPLDTAIYWTEYVIRHKGAPHLRSAAVGMPWYQYYLIDVISVIFLAISTVFVLLYYLIFKILLQLNYKTTKDKQC